MSIQKMKVISVLIVDDHPSVRAGVRTLLEESPDIYVVGEAQNGEDAKKLLEKLHPAIILLDLKIPDFSPYAFEKWAREKYPETITLVLTAHDHDAYLAGMMDSGASGFLSKTEAGERLISAIRSAMNGNSLFTEDQLARVQRWRQEVGEKWDDLTDRELQILSLLVSEGCDNQCIAEKLCITVKTAGFHVTNILKKLNVRSRHEAIVWARKYLPDNFERP